MNDIRKGIKYIVHKLAALNSVQERAHSIDAIAYAVRRRQLFVAYNIDLVIDVGANIGQFAQDLRGAYKGDIISFEPVSSAFEALTINAKSDPSWRIYNLALGSENTSKTINVTNSTVLSSFHTPNEYCKYKFGHNSSSKSQEVVVVKRLDEFLEESVPDYRQRRIFLKIDTQGFDLEVFKGLGQSIGFISALQSEVSVIPIYGGTAHWTNNISLFEEAGFDVTGLFPVNMDGCRVIEFDCLMARRRNSA